LTILDDFVVPHFRTPPYYSLDPPTSAATRIPTQDTTSGTFHIDQPQSPWKKQISILKTKVPACDCIYTRLLNIWSSNPHGIGSKNVKYTRIAIFHGESGDELSMFINVQTNPLVWLGIMIFGGWILFTCWCPICPLVGVLVVHLWDIVHFLDLIYKVWVYHQQKKRNCYYSHGISRTHMPDLLRNHQKHG
jgi:hypothetical protein